MKNWITAVLIPACLLTFLPVHAEDMEIASGHAVLMDTGSGSVLYEKDSQTQVPAGAMAIAMNVLASYDSTEEKVTFLSKDESFDTSAGLQNKKSYAVADLRAQAMLGGYQDASYALSLLGEDGVKLLNNKAAALSMTKTVFANVTGAADDAQVTTAHDLGLLGAALDTNAKDLYGASSYTLSDDAAVSRDVFSYDGLDGYYYWQDDTGVSAVASASRDGTRLTAAVMQADSEETAFSDLTKLLDDGYNNFKSVAITKDAVGTKELDIMDNGTNVHVSFALSSDLSVLMAKDADETALTTSIEVMDETSASDCRGYLVISMNGEEMGRFPLTKTTSEDVSSDASSKKTNVFGILCAAVTVASALLFVYKYASRLIKPHA